MLATTHSLVSALIITESPSPYIGMPLVLVFHYIFDLIPHWDTGSGMTKGLKTRRIAFLETVIDLIIAFGLVFFLFQKGKPFLPWLWGAIILGILPDLLEFPALFFQFRPFPLINSLEKFHTNIMHKSGKLPWGLIYQIVIILTVLWFIKR